jgi:hypothetical protein
MMVVGLDWRIDALETWTSRKLRLSRADHVQAANIYTDAHREGRDDIKARVRALLDQDAA